MSLELPSKPDGYAISLDAEVRLSQLLEVSIWIAQCKLEGRRWWVIATPDGGWRISKDDEEDDEWD